MHGTEVSQGDQDFLHDQCPHHYGVHELAQLPFPRDVMPGRDVRPEDLARISQAMAHYIGQTYHCIPAAQSGPSTIRVHGHYASCETDDAGNRTGLPIAEAAGALMRARCRKYGLPVRIVEHPNKDLKGAAPWVDFQFVPAETVH